MGLYMGARNAFVVSVRLLVPLLLLFSCLSGCQLANGPTKAQLLEHRQQVDDTGLLSPLTVAPLHASISVPAGWRATVLQKQTLYTHQQWRTPSKRTAIGVAYVRLPLPMTAKTLKWLAAGELAKRVSDGKLQRQWTDALGREWFEGSNAKYHMIGYVMTNGTDAWINYAGHRVADPLEPEAFQLAKKALDAILPGLSLPPTATASADER